MEMKSNCPDEIERLANGTSKELDKFALKTTKAKTMESLAATLKLTKWKEISMV